MRNFRQYKRIDDILLAVGVELTVGGRDVSGSNTVVLGRVCEGRIFQTGVTPSLRIASLSEDILGSLVFLA